MHIICNDIRIMQCYIWTEIIFWHQNEEVDFSSVLSFCFKLFCLESEAHFVMFAVFSQVLGSTTAYVY